MKTLNSLLLVASCLLALSCAAHEQTKNDPTAAPSSAPTATTPVHDNVAGGLATPERGETETAEFKGTAGVTQKKRAGEPVLLREVRTGKHESYDRVVFEFEGNSLPGYVIEYVNKPVRDCGQGQAVPLSAAAALMISLQPANAHTEAGQATVQNRQQNPNFNVLKELKLICDFEAEVQTALGLSSPNQYRVLELTSPARLVVDISHKKSGQ